MADETAVAPPARGAVALLAEARALIAQYGQGVS